MHVKFDNLIKIHDLCHHKATKETINQLKEESLSPFFFFFSVSVGFDCP